MSSLITLSWFFTGLSLLILRMYIKRTGGSNSVDFNRGFSYIISSWLMEEVQKSTDMTSYITPFYSTSSKIYIYIGVFSGGLLQYFVGIAILTCFGGAC